MKLGWLPIERDSSLAHKDSARVVIAADTAAVDPESVVRTTAAPGNALGGNGAIKVSHLQARKHLEEQNEKTNCAYHLLKQKCNLLQSPSMLKQGEWLLCKIILPEAQLSLVLVR